MKVIVAIKRVPDQDIPVRLAADGQDIDPDFTQMIINPFDEVALEEGVRLKERGLASEVLVVSCGRESSRETLRTALAFGADRALLVESTEDLQSLAIAKLLAAITRREGAALVLCGKQATDTDTAEVPVMLAGLLGWGQATIVSGLHIEAQSLTATCEVDGGQERLAVSLPAVVSTDLRLNLPRHLSLRACMAAHKKNIETLTPEAIGVGVCARVQSLGLTEPPPRKLPVRVEDVDELVRRLRDEAGVL
jgi:electron transfer flavoprotein beta subunit